MPAPDALVVTQRRAIRIEDGRPPSAGLLILRRACCLGAIGLTLIVAFLIVTRMAAEIDHEWVESSIVRSSQRVMQGKPLYAPPTAEYVGDNYPPLFFYVSAGLMNVIGPSRGVCRTWSLAGAIAIALALWIVGRPGVGGAVPGRWSRVAILGLFWAFFPDGGQVYDLARVDMPALALAVWSLVVLLRNPGTGGAAMAGLLMAAAILTKHNMVLVGMGLGLGLLVFRRRSAFVYGLIAAGLPAIFFCGLHVSSQGWSSFYLFTQPSMHPMGGAGRWMRFLSDDLGHHGLLMFGGLTAAAVLLLRRRGGGTDRRRDADSTAGTILVLLAAGGGLLATLLGRLKAGGFTNNLCPMWVLGLIALSWMLPRLSRRVGRLSTAGPVRLEWVFWLVVSAQLVSLGRGFVDIPWGRYMGWTQRRQAVAQIDAVIARYSAEGPVWMPYHSFTPAGQSSFAHLCPVGFLMDARDFPAKSMFEADLAGHLERRHWSAIILDGEGDRFVSDRCTALLHEGYAEVALGLDNPEACGSLVGKRTHPSRLFVRRGVKTGAADRPARGDGERKHARLR